MSVARPAQKPAAPVTKTASQPTKRPISNRRVAIRYPLGLASAAKMSLDQSCIFHPVRVYNISTGGLGVVLRLPLEQGVEVFVQLTNRILDFTYDLAAKVAHTEQLPNGRWLVGFQFARELSLVELASIL